MLDALEEAFARQNAFLADASHELRTPLTILSGQLEVLAMEEDPDPDEVRRVERIARAEIDRMKRLVDDLLLLARADEAGFLRPRAHRPRRVPRPARRVACGPSAIGGSSWGTCRTIVVDADPDRLTQALRNLLRNAIVHTEPEGLIRLSAAERRRSRRPRRRR